jgi:hypothetical protein
MRLSRTVLIALLAGPAIAGCLPARPADESSFTAHRFPNGMAPDIVRIDVAVIERPAGDHYLSRVVWDLADEQTVDLERKPILDDNGFRVGLIGGLLPSDLLALLTSGKSCADPHRVQLRAGNSTPVPLGGEQAQCRFSLTRGNQVIPIQLDKARCFLEIVPTAADDGRTALRFTPVVKHGAERREPRVVRDPSGEHRWDMEVRQSTETYAALSWEVSVSPEEYVVIGTRLDREDTLGQRFFLDIDAAVPVQRLLVIRCGRMPSDKQPGETGTDEAPPLALQAGWRSARGTAPTTDAAGMHP